MNKTYIFICAIVFVLFSSFKTDLECEYAGSNIGFAKSQTEKAIGTEDINQARFYAYRALNAIEKSRKQLATCGCEYAEISIEEGLKDLKNAIKSTTLNTTKLLLERALNHTQEAIKSLREHHLHESKYGINTLVLNTKDTIMFKKSGVKTINERIDISLEKYRKSLVKIVETVDCKDAKAFAQNIFEHCEAQLLNKNLSEGKKYYNLRTKEITAQALKQIGKCPSRP
ncbi:hypothetical protein [Maribacter sp. 2304DJ31-5]|uniref:hypothetical protein n=1 Tax=Maribacter sp. 2304DJ31-5 TaxID=3386273 RepID=UPI0039BC3904